MAKRGPKPKKRKAGAPTKYKPEYCKRMIEFFSEAPYAEHLITNKDKKGNKFVIKERVANDLPLFCKFACDINVDMDTLTEWKKIHPKFSLAYKKAKQLQKNFLVQNMLNGKFSAPGSIFTAKNVLGWRDKQDITSDDKEIKGMTIYCPKEED